MSYAPLKLAHHILIIDDSARLRHSLTDLLASTCQAAGKPYSVFHADKSGQYQEANDLAQAPIPALPAENFRIYTAPAPREALFIIKAPLFERITIISDVAMPSDTDVGLIGMLQALVERALPVNLIFVSSDVQNRHVVARLVDTHKAYFVLKAGQLWDELSSNLINRPDSFRYRVIVADDLAGAKAVPPLVTSPEPEAAPNPETYQAQNPAELAGNEKAEAAPAPSESPPDELAILLEPKPAPEPEEEPVTPAPNEPKGIGKILKPLKGLAKVFRRS